MKKFVFILFFCLAGLTASADGYSYLIVQTADASQTALPLSGLKLTFQNGQLVASGASSATFEVSNLAKMFFSSTATAINGATGGAPSVNAQNGHLTVKASAGTRVVVYTPTGQALLQFVKQNDGPEQIGGQLVSGIYLVRVGDNVTKVLLK